MNLVLSVLLKLMCVASAIGLDFYVTHRVVYHAPEEPVYLYGLYIADAVATGIVIYLVTKYVMQFFRWCCYGVKRKLE